MGKVELGGLPILIRTQMTFQWSFVTNTVQLFLVGKKVLLVERSRQYT